MIVVSIMLWQIPQNLLLPKLITGEIQVKDAAT